MNTDLKIINAILNRHPNDAIRKIERLELGEIIDLVRELPVTSARQLLERMNMGKTLELLQSIDIETASTLIETALTPVSVQLLRMLPGERQEALVSRMDNEISAQIKRVLTYPESTVGAVANPFVTTLSEDQKISDARFVIGSSGLEILPNMVLLRRDRYFCGLVSLQKLLSEKDTTPLHECVETSLSILGDMDRKTQLENWDFEIMHVPVIDLEGRYLGVVTKDSLVRKKVRTQSNQAAKTTSVALGDLYRVGLSGLFYGTDEPGENKE